MSHLKGTGPFICGSGSDRTGHTSSTLSSGESGWGSSNTSGLHGFHLCLCVSELKSLLCHQCDHLSQHSVDVRLAGLLGGGCGSSFSSLCCTHNLILSGLCFTIVALVR